MKCKRIRQNIVLDLYGELSEKEKAELEKHIAECPECAGDYAYSRQVFEALGEADQEDVPEPVWNSSWTKISTAFQNQPGRKKAFVFLPKWSYAAAGVLLVFLLGIFAGRLWFPAAQQKGQAGGSFQADFQQTLKRHFDELKPVLLQMANYTARENGNGTVLMDRKTLQSLIIQNILLKNLLEEQNPKAWQLLEDVELVLRELANMEEDDPRTKSMVKELIEEREILLNMNIIQKM
jgi:hypothetical protein